MSTVEVPTGAAVAADRLGLNPVTKLAISMIVAAVLLSTFDPITSGVLLGAELLALPWLGLSLSRLGRRSLPVLVAAGTAGLVAVGYGAPSGALLTSVGPWTVSTGALAAGAALTTRILALALPAVLLLATTDPTDLADALVQVLRLPARFVLAALAAMRLTGVLATEWEMLTLARRARGLTDHRWWRRPLVSLGQLFALLVLALRRATVLATAMEARGFGTEAPRTWARPSRLRARDAAALAVVTAVAALAVVLRR